MGKKIVWALTALKQTEAIHQYILEDTQSLKTADKVVKAILDSTEIIENEPELYALDSLKLGNDGSYRAFVKFRYRISYRVMEDIIQILRVRHISRKPLKY